MTQLDWYLQVNLKARHLRLLVALDEFGNLRQTAEVSHVTVPAVSKALAELEKGLGLQLFKRTAQGLKPTAHGECLIRHARTLLGGLHQARDELNALSAGAQGRVHVGVLPASTSVLLPQALAELKRRAPGTGVRVTEGPVSALLPELWQGRLDMVVGRLPPRHTTSGLDEKALLEDPVVLMTGAQHALAGRRELAWSDLAPYPWVLPPSGSLLREPLERLLAHHGVQLAAHPVETLSTPVARAYLQITDAIGVMASTAAAEGSPPLAILPLGLPQLLRPSGVLWHKARGLSVGAALMMACLEAAAASQFRSTGLLAQAAGGSGTKSQP